jgi:hypothetical protein
LVLIGLINDSDYILERTVAARDVSMCEQEWPYPQALPSRDRTSYRKQASSGGWSCTASFDHSSIQM